MKILITGANGLLGQKLVELLAPQANITLVATSRGENKIFYNLPNYEYRSLDVTQQEQVEQVVGEEKPDVIIHTAALTKVDYCEEHQEECWQLNVTAVDYLLRASEQHGCFFLHLSTDFIFSGNKRLLTEEDEAAPVNYYGESKLASEKLVRESKAKWAIARTALVYGIVPQMSRSNIILWVKDSLEKGKEVNVVDDQFRTPTLAEDLAQGCALIAQQRAAGVFNISSEELLTPYEMALQTADFFDLDRSLIVRTDSTKFTQPARRPLETGLVIDKAKRVLGYQPHTFKQGIEIMDEQMKSIDAFS